MLSLPKFLKRPSMSISRGVKRPSQTHSFMSWKDKPSRMDNWKELLMDMFYVAFLIKLSDGYMECRLNVEEFVYSSSRFLGMYMAKFEMDQYLNKFASKDMLNNFYIVSYFYGIFIMVANTNETSQFTTVDPQHAACPAYRPYVFGYTVGWLMTRGATIIMYCIVAYYVRPQGLYVFFTKVPILTLSVIIISVNFHWPERSSLDSDHHHSYLSLAASLTEYLGFAVWQVCVAGTYTLKFVGPRAFIPVNINHQSGRTSTFILCVFGAALIEVMNPVLQPTVAYYVALTLSFTLLITMALAYFDVIPSKNAFHALGKSRLAGTIWIMIHPILAFSVFAVGVDLKRMLLTTSEDFNENERCMLGIFMSLSSLCVVVIRITHKNMMSIGGKVSLSLRVLVAVGHIIAAIDSLYRENQSRVSVLLIHLGLSIAFLLIDGYKYRRVDIYQRATALRTLDKNKSLELVSFSDSFEQTESEGPVEVPGGHAENWSQVMSDIVANKRRRLQNEWVERVGSNYSAPPGVRDAADNDTISIPQRFFSSSGIPSTTPKQVGNKVLYKPHSSSGVHTMDTGDVISVKRGQSAAQLKGYRTVPRLTKDEPKPIVVRKGMSASEIKELRAMGGEGVIAAPRGMSAATIGEARRRRSIDNPKGGRVVERVIIRRRKGDSRKSDSSSSAVALLNSLDTPPPPMQKIVERQESFETGGAVDSNPQSEYGGETKQSDNPNIESDEEVGVIQLSRSTKL